MRLIDADDLKDEFIWLKSVVCDCSKSGIQDVIQRIENAPTIDPESLPIVQELRKQLDQKSTQGKGLSWTVQEWRKKHRRCKWCQHYCSIQREELILFPALATDGFCTAKMRNVYCDIPRPFCEVFQVKDYKNLYRYLLDIINKR